MSDRIVLRGLRAWGRHGVLESERAQGQEFLLDVTLGLDTRAAAARDDLTRTANYAAVAQRVIEVAEGEPVALIETLAQRVADACLADPRVGEVEVTVHKPRAPMPVPCADVAVTIRRARE